MREGGELDELPTTLNALLGARLDRLEARGARRARARRGRGRALPPGGGRRALRRSRARPAVPGELGQLARKDLIRLAAASLVGGGVAYRFKHILVREAAYRATAKKLRASLHERFADWLERRRRRARRRVRGDPRLPPRAGLPLPDGARPGRRGHPHARRARGPPPRRCGRRANDRGDVHAAANLLGRATALLPPDSVERLELLPRYAYAVNESGVLWTKTSDLARSSTSGRPRSAIGASPPSAHPRSPERFSDPNVDLDEARALAEEGIEIFHRARRRGQAGAREPLARPMVFRVSGPARRGGGLARARARTRERRRRPASRAGSRHIARTGPRERPDARGRGDPPLRGAPCRQPRRPRPRGGDRALSVRAPRDGRPLRRGARSTGADSDRVLERGEPGHVVACAQNVAPTQGARRRPRRRDPRSRGEVARRSATPSAERPIATEWRRPTSSPSSTATTAAGTTPRMPCLLPRRPRSRRI